MSESNTMSNEKSQENNLDLMETELLTDDIHIKMNGRGRSLSYFENLKSCMGKKIISHFGQDSEFTTDWQKKIDSKWADFFWANHDKSQDHPEGIDDEQQQFFYNLLRIFWTKNDKTFVQNKNRKLLYHGLGIEENIDVDIEREIVYRMEDSLLPLFIFEKTNLFSKEFFVWAKKALDGISELSQQINTCSIEFNLSSDANKKTLCNEIFFDNENRKLLIMLGIIDYCIECNNSDFFEWLRFIRNLECNMGYHFDHIFDLFFIRERETIEEIAQETKEKNSILEVLETIDPENYVSLDVQERLEEERTKATLLLKDPDKWRTRIKEIENNPLFTGKIKFMFDVLGNEPDTEMFDKYASLMNKLFSKENDGYFNSKIDMKLFSQALLCFPKGNVTKIYGYCYRDDCSTWSFLNYPKMNYDAWKKFINDSDENDIIKQLLEELIHKYNGSLCNATLKTIINEHKDSITDWRKLFFEYEELWQCMDKRLWWRQSPCWDGENEILLIAKKTVNGYYAELRTYCLYLDYEKENPSKEKSGWKFNFYGYNIWFEKEISDKKIIIDLCFDAPNATSEDFYQLEIFLCDSKGRESRNYLDKYMCEYMTNHKEYDKSGMGYLISKKSKEGIKQEIEELLNIPFA